MPESVLVISDHSPESAEDTDTRARSSASASTNSTRRLNSVRAPDEKVCHQTVDDQSHRNLFVSLLHQPLEGRVVGILMKNISPPVAPIEHVINESALPSSVLPGSRAYFEQVMQLSRMSPEFFQMPFPPITFSHTLTALLRPRKIRPFVRFVVFSQNQNTFVSPRCFGTDTLLLRLLRGNSHGCFDVNSFG
jgi:hypothetical protein